MKHILITGGCGFIGTNLVRRLAARGDRLRVLDNLSTGSAGDIAEYGVQLMRGDILDAGAVRAAVKGKTAVVHLAAQTGVVPSQREPRVDFEVNARGTLEMLSASRDANVESFVFASTGGAILGEQMPPVDETMAAHPLSPYGASKLAGEGYCAAFHGSFGLPTVALRFSNVYGPFSYHKGSVVAQFFKLIQEGQPLTMYGDGTQTRDFLYVDDLVDAVVAAIDSRLGGEVFHIASGVETSVNDLIAAMRDVLPGERLDIDSAPARPGEVTRNFACIEKATRMLDYRPRVTLRDGLRATWAWFQERGLPRTASRGA